MINTWMKKGTALFCSVLLLGMAACNAKTSGGNTAPTAMPQQGSFGVGTETVTGEAPAVTVAPEIRAVIEDVTKSEVTEEAEITTQVSLSDGGIEISGSGCEADGTRLKIKEAGTYELSGTLSNGSIYVNTDNTSEVHLILNGVTVHNETSAALFCKKAAKVTVTLAEGSVNTLSDGATYVFEEGEDEPDATLYAKHDLVINGSGTLNVTSAYGDAIKGKDSLYILGGEISVNSADDGIVGRDLLYIADGEFAVTAASDALKSTNDTDTSLGNIVIDGGTFLLVAGTDGIQAENTLTVNGGTFTIESGGGSVNASVKSDMDAMGFWGRWGMTTDTETTETTSSAKGMKATSSLNINGGVFRLDTSDDALHSNGDLQITGGEFTIVSGDDGAHADNVLTISGSCKMQITKSYEGVEALEITIAGGEIEITASDDGLNAAGGADGSGFGRPGAGMFSEGEGEVTITGGVLTVNASGDGLDSNGNLTINGGTVLVYGPTSGGNGVLDYGGSFLLNGGSLLCVGTSDMAQTPTSTSGQYSLAATVTAAQAGSVVEVVVNKETVLSTTVPKSFNYIVASTADFAADAEVGVLVNGEEVCTGTLTEVVTCFGNIGGMGGMGGFGGNFGGGDFGGGDFGGGGNFGGMGGRGNGGMRP